MAGVALHIAHVVLRIHLRKPCGFGDIGLVAAGTQGEGLGKLGNYIGRVGGMLGQRAMAGFAVDARVFAGFLQFQDISVTVFTGLVSGEARFASRKFFQRVAAIVTVFSETFGNEVCPKREEDDNSKEEDGGEPQKMLDIFEFAHGSIHEVPHTGRAASGPNAWFM